MRAAWIWVGLAIPGIARAWDGTVEPTLSLSATTTDVVTVPVDGAPRLLVTGPGRSWLLDAEGREVVATAAAGGEAIAPGRPGEAWLCGLQGLQRLGVSAEGLVPGDVVDPTPCRAVARVATDDGPVLVTAGTTVQTRALGADEAPGPPRTLDLVVDGWPLLAAERRRFAVASEGGRTVYEDGPWGTSSIVAEAPVAGLASGPGAWAWSLPDGPDGPSLVDVTRRRIAVAAGPGRLVGADLDGDERRDLIVLHPEAGHVGVVRGGTAAETLIDAPRGLRAAHAADLDGDGCDEVVVLGLAGDLARLDGSCGGASAPMAATPARGERVVIGEGWPEVHVPVGDRLELRLVDERGQATAWAASGGPAGLVLTSSGTLLYTPTARDVGRWRVVVRMWVDGAWARRGGLEIVVDNPDGTPPPEGPRSREGAAAVAAAAPRPTPSTRPAPPGPRDRSRLDLAAALDEEVGHLERALPVRGCSFGFGGALGGSRARASWVLLGSGFLLAGSPAISLACDGGQEQGLWWFAGLDMAPWFAYLVNDTPLRHGLASTAGVGWTNSTWSVGGYGTAGATLVGLGPVVRYTPFERSSGARHGPELRVTWMPASDFVVEGILMYTIQLGPYR